MRGRRRLRSSQRRRARLVSTECEAGRVLHEGADLVVDAVESAPSDNLCGSATGAVEAHPVPDQRSPQDHQAQRLAG